jgi:hypothetical protein
MKRTAIVNLSRTLAVAAAFFALSGLCHAQSVTPGGGTTVTITGGSSTSSVGFVTTPAVTPSFAASPNAALGPGAPDPNAPLVPEPAPAVPVIIGVGLLGIMALIKKLRPTNITRRASM